MLQVPLAETHVALPPSPAPRPDPQLRLAGKIGFLVENDEDLRRAMGLLLEKWGISVIDAGSGEEALALLDELGILPDFLLVDHQLGEGMSGLDLLRHLRLRHGNLPARLITADRSEGLMAEATRDGIGMIYKPIEPRALMGFLSLLPEGTP